MDKKIINKNQLMKIAKAGFPEKSFKNLDIENSEYHSQGGIYRLYDPADGFISTVPMTTYISIIYNSTTNFVQFTVGNRAFNHFAAIEKMRELNLIKDEVKKKIIEDIGFSMFETQIVTKMIQEKINFANNSESFERLTRIREKMHNLYRLLSDYTSKS